MCGVESSILLGVWKGLIARVCVGEQLSKISVGRLLGLRVSNDLPYSRDYYEIYRVSTVLHRRGQ